jgi:hypothetical protein
VMAMTGLAAGIMFVSWALIPHSGEGLCFSVILF